MNCFPRTNEDSHSYRQRLINYYSSVETLDQMRYTLAKEWIARYNEKMKTIGKAKAIAWWRTQVDIMEAKRGLTFTTDLQGLMNEIRKEG